MLDRLRDLQQLEGVAGNCENWLREFRGGVRKTFLCLWLNWKPYLENTFWLKEEPKKGKGISPATESINKHNRIFSGL